MPQIVSVFSDGSRVEFDAGKFDSWCVYYKRTNGERTAPKDINYFANFRRLGRKHGSQQIYGDFLLIYERTTKVIDLEIVSFIKMLALKYREDSLEIEKLFTVVYAGMVAEENKQNAVLGKRVKRLGLHQILIEKLTPKYAANFSKGKRAAELRLEFEKRGFH